MTAIEYTDKYIYVPPSKDEHPCHWCLTDGGTPLCGSTLNYRKPAHTVEECKNAGHASCAMCDLMYTGKFDDTLQRK